MKRKIRISARTIENIEFKKVTRGKIESFVMNFLMNFGLALEVLRLVQVNTEKSEYVQMALSQHVVTLISLCETLFRDIFVCILENQKDYKDMIINAYNLEIKNDINVPTEINDILPEFFNFQNIYDIEKVFKFIIHGDDFYYEIGSLVVPLYNSKEQKIKNLSLNKSFENWFQLYDQIIQERHKIVHDSNYKTKITASDIIPYQRLVLFFNQILALWITGKFRLPYIMIKVKESLQIPYILDLEDFNHDWEIVD